MYDGSMRIDFVLKDTGTPLTFSFVIVTKISELPKASEFVGRLIF